MPPLYENIDVFFCRIESLGEVRKLSQVTYDCAKVSEGCENCNSKVIVLQTSLYLI